MARYGATLVLLLSMLLFNNNYLIGAHALATDVAYPLPANWHSSGPYDDAMQPVSVADVAASPAYATDGTLFAAADGHVYRSTNRGQSWQPMLAGEPSDSDSRFTHVRVSPGYTFDHTVFASFVNTTAGTAGLYKSTDSGANWTLCGDVGEVRAIAVSPAYVADQTLWVARGDEVYKSTDGCSTWNTYRLVPVGESFDVFDIAVSPAFTVDDALIVTGYGPARYSSDGGETWRSVGGYAPSYEVAFSPSYLMDATIWATYRSIEAPGNGTPESGVYRSTDRAATWSLATAGLPGWYEPYPCHLAVSPDYAVDQSLFTALSGEFVAGTTHSLFRSLNGGGTWLELGPAPGNPDVFGLIATATETEGVTAHLATAAGVWHYGGPCEEGLVNGGFETDVAWTIPTTAYPAGYDTTIAHTGLRSLRAGIVSGTDTYSYSSARQTVTIPADVSIATLSLWWYPLSNEGPLPAASDAPAPGTSMPALESTMSTQSAADVDDRQYVMVLDEVGNILEILLWTRSDAGRWQEETFDLSAYAGQTVQVYVGVLNDGDGKSTAMYVDDVSLIACRATPSVTSMVYLPVVLKQEAPPPEPRWLRSLVAEPGTGRLIGLTNEGYLMTSSDFGASWATIPLPAEIAGTPLAYRGHVAMDYRNPHVLYLGAGLQGLWRSLDGGATWAQRSAINAGPVAVSLDDSSVLWAGIPWDNVLQSVLVRTSDAGLNWTGAGDGLIGDPFGQIIIDPQQHNLRFVITQYFRGGARLYRTGNEIWEQILTAPLGFPVYGTPMGLAMNGQTRGLYLGAGEGILWVSYNAHALAVGDVRWEQVYEFAGRTAVMPLAVGRGPTGNESLYVTVYDWDAGVGRVMRSDDGGASWVEISIPVPAVK